MTKVVENTFRSENIAFENEFNKDLQYVSESAILAQGLEVTKK